MQTISTITTKFFSYYLYDDRYEIHVAPQSKLMEWLEDKRYLSQRYFEAININNFELFGVIKKHQNKLRPLSPLIAFIIDRLSAVTHLAVQDMVWDAEIVHRTALESFIKFLFITSEPSNQELLLNEYWTDLKEINSLKLSEQAKKNIEQFGHIEIARLAYSPIILPPEKEEILRKKWTKAKRQQLEQKWSFSEILRSLMNNYKGSSNKNFVGLAHSYRMASHVGHGDETGVLIIAERDCRLQEQKDIANFAHFLRLMSDSFDYCIWTAVETAIFVGEYPKVFIELSKSLNDVHDLVQKYHRKVYEDPDYEQF